MIYTEHNFFKIWWYPQICSGIMPKFESETTERELSA